MLLHLLLRLPHPLIALLVLPLHLYQSHLRVSQGHGLPIEDPNRSVYVVQALVQLNVLQ